MNTLFPLITEYNEEFKEYYTYRQIYFKWNINSEAYRLHKQYTDFPDPSYYWVYPKGEEPKERHVLFGTYYVQHEIWKHQFPATCEDKKYLIVPVKNGGLGCIIHALAHSLAVSIEHNRILVVKPLYRSPWGDPEFCDKEDTSIMCYFQPITNCSISDVDVLQAYNDNKEFNSTTHGHLTNIRLLNNYASVKYIFSGLSFRWRTPPTYVNNLLDLGSIPNEAKWWYWRTQGITFLTRLNERTLNWIHDYEKENCKECKNEYDFTIYIRHGDKGIEMKLIDADVYKEAINIITSFGMKKNYTIYVNADDQESVDAIASLPYTVTSLNRTRTNVGISQLKEEQHIGLISLADIDNEIRGDHCIGTIGSNWNRLIYELKMTVGLKSDGFILDVGDEYCMSHSHCQLRNTKFYSY